MIESESSRLIPLLGAALHLAQLQRATKRKNKDIQQAAKEFDHLYEEAYPNYIDSKLYFVEYEGKSYQLVFKEGYFSLCCYCSFSNYSL
jgi:hypothetical protein